MQNHILKKHRWLFSVELLSEKQNHVQGCWVPFANDETTYERKEEEIQCWRTISVETEMNPHFDTCGRFLQNSTSAVRAGEARVLPVTARGFRMIRRVSGVAGAACVGMAGIEAVGGQGLAGGVGVEVGAGEVKRP